MDEDCMLTALALCFFECESVVGAAGVCESDER